LPESSSSSLDGVLLLPDFPGNRHLTTQVKSLSPISPVKDNSSPFALDGVS
jgi:hypothetical protein